MDVGLLPAVLMLAGSILLVIVLCCYAVYRKPQPEPEPRLYIVPSDLDCCVCMDAKAGVIFPCGHNAVCVNCAQRITLCPLCRQRLTSVQLVVLHSAV